MTHKRIFQFFENTQSDRSPHLQEQLVKFVQIQRTYLEDNVKKFKNGHESDDEDDARYWHVVGSLLSQVRGLHDGYNQAASKSDGKTLSLDQFWLINMDGDLIELQNAVSKGLVEMPGTRSAPPPSDGVQAEDRFQQVSMSDQWKTALGRTVSKTLQHNGAGDGKSFLELRAQTNPRTPSHEFGPIPDDAFNEWSSLVRRVGHCTALVALTADGKDLLVGHNSWEDYNEMLRSFKHYEFAHPGHSGRHSSDKAHRVSMSSYPGLLASTDDYYQLGNGLVIVETTIVIFDPSVLRKIQIKAVPSWIASLTANRLASSAKEWTDVFQKHNAGTYNCQWMVIDYSKFRARHTKQSLPAGTFWVVETVPGLAVARDMTETLERRRFWLSANRPFFPQIRSATGYDSRESDVVSFDHNPRAQLAHRIVPSQVHSLEQLMWFMRYNHFRLDSESRNDPAYSIAARSDLDPMRPTFTGAVDAKCVDEAGVEAMRTMAISGPTAQSQKPFSFADWSTTPIKHEGMPQTFNFDWYSMTGYQPKHHVYGHDHSSCGDSHPVVDHAVECRPALLAKAVRQCL